METLFEILGLRMSRYDRGLLPINSSAGLCPVVVWGVILYWKRKRASSSSMLPAVIFFNPVLRVCTACSANPFDAGWYGAVVRCLMPFMSVKWLNSLLVKTEPLSVTIVSGIP